MSTIEESFNFIIDAFNQCDEDGFYKRLTNMESDTEKTQTEDSLDNNATYACKDLEELDDDPFAESTANGEPSNVATSPAIHYSTDCEQKLREQTLSVLRVIFGQNLNANKKPNSPRCKKASPSEYLKNQGKKPRK